MPDKNHARSGLAAHLNKMKQRHEHLSKPDKPANQPAPVYCRWIGHACDCQQHECRLSGTTYTIATNTTIPLTERTKPND